MRLLDQYLKAVGHYLPKVQKNDILKELSENLMAKLEEKESEIGRPLTEREQAAILMDHGDPMLVASHYGSPLRSVAFGRQLISPELFPYYFWILLLNIAIQIIAHGLIAILTKNYNPRACLIGIGAAFAATTLVFILIDWFQRKSRKQWFFPPAYLLDIPRWSSAFGLMFWIIYSLYWAAIPYAPSLILGPAADNLKLAPVWHTFYWPILLLLLAGVAQRIINLVRPQWNLLPYAVRLAVNITGLAMLYFLLNGRPFVCVADRATNLMEAERQALSYNEHIWWFLAIGFSIAWVIYGGVAGWFFTKHILYLLRRRSEKSR
jgi:hypothetical protein